MFVLVVQTCQNCTIKNALLYSRPKTETQVKTFTKKVDENFGIQSDE